MKKHLMLFSALALTLVACENRDKPVAPPPTPTPPRASNLIGVTDTRTTIDEQSTHSPARPNSFTKRNNSATDQLENDADLRLTQKIRQALVADKSLSMSAKNITVTAVNGLVTLRGNVDSVRERDAIVQKVKAVSGVSTIDNQLDVPRNR